MPSNIKSTSFFSFLLSLFLVCFVLLLLCFVLVCGFLDLHRDYVGHFWWPTAGYLPIPACLWYSPWKAVAVFFLYLGALTVAQWPVIPWSLSHGLRAPGVAVMPLHSYELTQTNTAPSWGLKFTFSHCFGSPRNMFPGPF